MIVFEKGERVRSNPLYRKLYALWSNMQARCLHPNHPAYKNYGGNGVIIAPVWATFNSFLATVDTVVGWDKEQFLGIGLSLDKDSVIKGNKVYSPETCVFTTRDCNNKIKPNQQKEIVGVSQTGERYVFSNQSEFAKIHKLRQSTISDCLAGRVNKHQGWTFFYK